MFINLVQAAFIAVFIAVSVSALKREKENAYGLLVYRNGTLIADGKQGVQTTFGRSHLNDVKTDNANTAISRLMGSLEFLGDSILRHEWCRDNGQVSDGHYTIADERYRLDRSKTLRAVPYKLLLLLLSCFILLLRALSLKQTYGVSCAMPIGILFVYLIASYVTGYRANGAPVIEGSVAILLTYYINAMLYKPDVLSPALKKATLGVLCYVLFAALTKTALMALPTEKALFRLAGKHRYGEGITVTVHDCVRAAAALGIFTFIAFNLIFKKTVNNAHNWAGFGSFIIQPGEMMKPLFLTALVLPLGKKLELVPKRLNAAYFIQLFYFIALPAVTFVYALVIHDTGLLLELGFVWAAALILQEDNLLLAPFAAAISLLTGKGVLLLSKTALHRFSDWYIDGHPLKSIFSNIKDVSAQQKMALLGIRHGGLLGSEFYDMTMLRAKPASDCDIVLASLAERYGLLLVVMLFALFALIGYTALVNLRRQTKLQQGVTLNAVLLLFAAVLLNALGTVNKLPFTGIVLPFMSAGVSAAVGYGICTGFMTSYSKNIYKIVATATVTEESNPLKAHWERALLPRLPFDPDAGCQKLKALGSAALLRMKSFRLPKRSAGRNRRKKAVIIAAVAIFVTAVSVAAAVLMQPFTQIQTLEKQPHVTAADKLMQNDEVMNLLLLGVDARKGQEKEETRSDAMMLVSIDKAHGSIKITSFQRDAWMYIPALKKEQRLNAACSHGGYAGVIDALEYNFGIPVQGYAAIDFNSFEALIDSVGGVEIDVTKQEAHEVNSHPNVYRKARLKAGTHTLSGRQALAYSRIRKIDSDFGRTQRQRTVINALINKAKGAGPVTLYKMAASASGYIETDLTFSELFSAGVSALPCLGGTTKQEKMPFDHTWDYANKNGASVIVFNDEKNKKLLKEFIYEE